MKKFFILVIVILAVVSIPINNEKIIISKGNIFWGEKKKCYKIEIMTADIVERKCKLCNGKFEGSSSEILCRSCCILTNRCGVCGKIKESNY